MARKRAAARQELEDGSAVIDLSQPPSPDESLSSDTLPDYGAKPEGDSGVKAEVVKTTEPPPREPEPAFHEPDLVSQVEALKKREQRARERADAAEQARAQAEQARQAEVSRTRVELESTQYDSVANALAARKSEAQQAKQEYASARASNDAMAEAEALERMQRANADIVELERGKFEFERRFEQRKNAPPPPPVAPAGNSGVEHILAQMPALTNEERDWIRKHPEVVTNQENIVSMQVAFRDAQKKGIRRNSPEYFQFFNDRLGFEDEAQEPDYEEDEMDDDLPEVKSPPLQPRQAPERRAPSYAAPVSRSAPGASSRETSRSDSKITLTPQQREAAKISKISEREYAENLRKLNRMKANGHYGERG